MSIYGYDVGNLALVEQQHGDVEAARACMDEHLSLVQTLHDKTAETLALHKMGELASKTGDFDEAESFFRDSRAIAKKTNSEGLSKVAKVQMGIAGGNAKMKEEMAALLGRFKATA